MGRQSPLLVQYASQTAPYVEMLVPRRKGQLLKLLILIPLSLLLATSIYYQFYYSEPPLSGADAGVLGSDRPGAAAEPLVAFSGPGNFDPNGGLGQDPAGAYRSLVSSQEQRRRQAASNDENANNRSQQTNKEQLLKRPRFKSKLTYNQANRDHPHESLPGEASGQSPTSQEAASGRNANHHNKNTHNQRDNQNNQNLNNNSDLGNDLIDVSDESTNDLGSGAADDNNSPPVAGGAQDEQPRQGPQSNNNRAQQQHQSSSSTEMQREAQEAKDDQDAAVLPAPSELNGPGEMGRPVVLKNLTKEQQQLVNVGWENNAFNQYVSDIISVNRSLPDVRDPACKPLKYPQVSELPPTSVIICFHNEAWSVLLRTVHSVLNRSPRHLIKEIILVDDFSNKPYLGQQLDDYVRQLRVVKVVRAQKREGLIRARLLGAEQATAPVLTFLDSHCECAEGWLEPLLARIHEDPRAVVCPVIDVISDKTFEYHYKGDANAVSVGGFDWNLQFNWHSIPERERKRRKHATDPLRSPTMAGGLFSIDKAFFERLGTYDSGFDIWGGENLELSFKTWMCGGTLEIVPCSHVGHVFRSRSPYKWRTGVNVLRRNSVRLAEVWMDDYKRYYYDRIGHELGDYGDVSGRKALREQLQCKPFSYFVHEIYPELFIPGEAIAYGEVRNEAEGHIKMCLDSSARKSDFHKPLGLYPCHGSGGNQYWLLSRDGEIRRDEACVDYAGKDVVLFPCHGSGGNQLWLYDNQSQLVRHGTSGRCMELEHDRIKLKMSDCDPNNDAQKWTFQHYNATLAAHYRTSSTASTGL